MIGNPMIDLPMWNINLLPELNYLLSYCHLIDKTPSQIYLVNPQPPRKRYLVLKRAWKDPEPDLKQIDPMRTSCAIG